MANEVGSTDDFQRSKGRDAVHSSSAVTQDAGQIAGLDENIHFVGSMVDALGISGRGNAQVRQSALLNMQRTHGNRAVQRAYNASSSAPRVSVQRNMWEDTYAELEARFGKDNPALEAHKWMLGTGSEEGSGSEAANARKGRTTTSKTVTAVKEGSKALTAMSAGGSAIKTENEAWWAYMKALKEGKVDKTTSAIGAHDDASKALGELSSDEVTKGSKGYDRSRWVDKHLGTNSTVGKGLRGSNYALQLLENLTKGQGVGEAIVGAGAGGFVNNNMTRMLFDKSSFMHTTKPIGKGSLGPVSGKIGWIDTLVNLGNAGLKLIGAPDEVTTVTQTVADATPSSFGTSLASNAGRGLYNLVTGDFDALEEQGQSIVQGKEGAPLQGYAVAGEAIYHGLSGDSAALSKIAEENRSGKRGTLAKWGSKIGGAIYDADKAVENWTGDRIDSAMGRGTRAQRENKLYRQAALEREHREREEKEQAEKAALEKEMESYKVSGYAPYNPFQQPTKIDEDGLPPTSMKL